MANTYQFCIEEVSKKGDLVKEILAKSDSISFETDYCGYISESTLRAVIKELKQYNRNEEHSLEEFFSLKGSIDELGIRSRKEFERYLRMICDQNKEVEDALVRGSKIGIDEFRFPLKCDVISQKVSAVGLGSIGTIKRIFKCKKNSLIEALDGHDFLRPLVISGTVYENFAFYCNNQAIAMIDNENDILLITEHFLRMDPSFSKRYTMELM